MVKYLFMFISLTLFWLADGSEYCVFLDSGYALSEAFITPFSRRRRLTPEERAFNRFVVQYFCVI